MALTVLIYVTYPLWNHILPSARQGGVELLGGLLMFFQVVTHLAIMQMVAKLREQPAVIALSALAGIAVNVGLFLLWADRGDPAGSAIAAARAAGVGMYIGGGAVAVAYFLIAKVRLEMRTYLIAMAPVVLLLPRQTAGILWLVVMVATVTTPLLFTRRQKQLIWTMARTAWPRVSGDVV